MNEEVVEWTVRHELQCADRVGYALEVIALSVGKVVHGINVPLSACAPVRTLDDAINDWVAEVHVVACHVDFGAQHKLALVHALKKVEVFLG